MSQQYNPRNIVATIHRVGVPTTVRRYVRLNTAIPTMTASLLQVGQPRDVVEFSHATTGLQIGTIKVKAGGRMETTWVWDTPPS